MTRPYPGTKPVADSTLLRLNLCISFEEGPIPTEVGAHHGVGKLAGSLYIIRTRPCETTAVGANRCHGLISCGNKGLDNMRHKQSSLQVRAVHSLPSSHPAILPSARWSILDVHCLGGLLDHGTRKPSGGEEVVAKPVPPSGRHAA